MLAQYGREERARLGNLALAGHVPYVMYIDGGVGLKLSKLCGVGTT